MKIDKLLGEIPGSAGAAYSCDRGIEFKGLAYRVPRTFQPGQFLVLMDNSWGKLNVKRYAPKSGGLSGHIRKAREAGVAGFICHPDTASSSALEGAAIITAEHTLTLAYRIAEVMRDRRGSSRITAITGSAGKSTTKAMLTHALRSTAQFSVQSPPHGQNIFPSLISHYSRIGQADHAVLEVAGSCFRPFSRKDFQLAADVSIVTSIAEAHIDYLGGLKEIAQRKSDIFNGTAPGGTAVINADAPHSDLLVRRATEEGRQIVTYGEHHDVTIQLDQYDPHSRRVTARIGRERLTYTIGAAGRHMALNSLAVLAALRAYRIPEWRQMIESLATFTALEGRGDVTTATVRDGVEVTLIDEAYNANPASMLASLRNLEESYPESRRVAVLGDMLELGDSAQELHNALAEPVNKFPPAALHLYGPQMEGLYRRLDEFPGTVHHWADAKQLERHLKTELQHGDAVLIKSSQGTGLHQLVSTMKATV